MSELEPITDNSMQLCTFWLEDNLYGVNIIDVKEVNSELTFTPIDHSSEKVCGYVNIRGNIHLVINMRTIMGFENKEYDEQNRVVLFKPDVGESFGVLVDSVGDVVEVKEGLIENRRINEDHSINNDRRKDTDLGMGVYKLDDNLMVILNPRNFLNVI